MPELSGDQGNVLATVVDFAGYGDEIVEHIPPTSWLPVTATASELSFFGIPARPASGPALTAWNDEWITEYSGISLADPCAPLPIGSQVTTSDPSCPYSDAFCSRNWGGMISTEGSITEAYAETRSEAGIACNDQPDSWAHWVGIGGFNTEQLLQNGFIDIQQQSTNEAFYEGVDEVAGGDLGGGVQPAELGFAYGVDDIFNISTTYTPAQPKVLAAAKFGWHDLTNGQLASITVEYLNGYSISDFYQGASGEVIDERADFDTGFSELLNFGSDSWAQAQVAQNGGALEPIRSVAHEGTEMYDHFTGITYAEVGPTNPNPEDFSDVWATCRQEGG